ncbi:MAG: glycosyltransferase family 4 protein [Nitrospirae bacterium]|nr:glycosyltransferase family 4 protein [Nitrospirota bacterium]MBF0554109.1 glycosyltransferase family 4 protein [Nitrospirota bacterium]
MKKKLLFFITEDWYFCSHRLPIAIAACNNNFDVVVVTRVHKHADEIIKHGIKLIPLSIDRKGLNPSRDLFSFIKLIKIYISERPDIVHHVAMKPIIYGTIAAFISGVPHVINAIAGMGYLFTSATTHVRILQYIIKFIFKFILSLDNCKIIVQNYDDMRLLQDSCNIKRDNIVVIRGSGVDTNVFTYLPEITGIITVILASRMLWDKGIGEYIEAIKRLKETAIKAHFILAGDSDEHNPSAISRDQLQQWHNDGIIEWLGHVDNMQERFMQAHIVCLPTYREGLPKVLLEASACGRPVITTDVPGCREIVKHGKNGLLVPPKNVDALVEALQILINDPQLRQELGKNARKIVLEEFTIERIISETISLYKHLISKNDKDK